MRMSKNIIAITFALLMVSCSYSSLRPEVVDRADAQRMQTVIFATVVSIDRVILSGDGDTGAPVSPSPDKITLSIETTVAKITVCILCASARSTTSGLNELYEQLTINNAKVIAMIFLDILILIILLFKILF